MTDNELSALAMIAVGAIAAAYGISALVRARHSGVLRLLGNEVSQHSWTAYQALVALTVLLTIVAFLALLIGLGIGLLLTGEGK